MQHRKDTIEPDNEPGMAGRFYQTSRHMTREEEIASMREALQERKHRAQNQASASMESRGAIDRLTSIPMYRLKPLMQRVEDLQHITGEKPAGWKKPTYGNVDYIIAHKMGWITDEEEQGDRQVYELRRKRSLQTCHRYNANTILLDEQLSGVAQAGDGFIPEVSSRILSDQNLTDGSRRFAMRLMEQTYRANREGRCLKVTVTYLMASLKRSRRTIQNYLRLLERLGYIKVDVILGETTKMCAGLLIELLTPLFAAHHKEKWPEKRRSPINSDAQMDSLKYRNIYLNIEDLQLATVQDWAKKCMDGVFRIFMKSYTPLTPVKLLSA